MKFIIDSSRMENRRERGKILSAMKKKLESEPARKKNGKTGMD